MSMRNIYRKIAKENGVTVSRIKKEMQAALNEAYNSKEKDAAIKIYQSKVPCKGTVPTPDEFLKYVQNKLKK